MLCFSFLFCASRLERDGNYSLLSARSLLVPGHCLPLHPLYCGDHAHRHQVKQKGFPTYYFETDMFKMCLNILVKTIFPNAPIMSQHMKN